VRCPAGLRRGRRRASPTDEQAEVVAQFGSIKGEREAEIGVEAALVELVEQYRRDARQFRVVEKHTGEDTLGDDFDTGFRAHAAIEPDAMKPTVSPIFSPSVTAIRCAAARAARRRGSSMTMRPSRRHFASRRRQRHARGLAGAGRRDEYGAIASLQCVEEAGECVVDGEGRNPCRYMERNGGFGKLVR